MPRTKLYLVFVTACNSWLSVVKLRNIAWFLISFVLGCSLDNSILL